MKTKFAAIALLLVPILALHAAPLAFEEVLLLVRMHETDAFIGQQVSQRRLLHALTPREEAALKEQGASEAVLQALRNPGAQLSKEEIAAFEARREQQKVVMQEQAQREAREAQDSAALIKKLAAAQVVNRVRSKWGTNYNKALEQARAEDKAVLLDFTGSDWCGWCISMMGETFNKQEFVDYAEKNLVLVEVDFPRRKVLSAEDKAQNSELARRYAVRSYPTYVLLDKYGKVLGRQSGYVPGGPGGMIAKLEGFKGGSR